MSSQKMKINFLRVMGQMANTFMVGIKIFSDNRKKIKEVV